METPSTSPQFHHAHAFASRLSIGFPFGTALALILIFTLTTLITCCCHLNKLRFFCRSFPGNRNPTSDDIEASPPRPEIKRDQGQSVPVVMPGDIVPKFIAMPCPCEPIRADQKLVIKVQKPPKPPRIVVPFY